jgi:hypothetical protein
MGSHDFSEPKGVRVMVFGGEGSGNFDHGGRPGEVGGSSSTGGGEEVKAEQAPQNPTSMFAKHSPVSVVRWMGKNGYSEFKTRQVLNYHGIKLADSVIKNHLRAGANGTGPPVAPLSQQHIDTISAITGQQANDLGSREPEVEKVPEVEKTPEQEAKDLIQKTYLQERGARAERSLTRRVEKGLKEYSKRNRNSGVEVRNSTLYRAALRRSFERMSDKAKILTARGTQSFKFHSTVDEVDAAYKSLWGSTDSGVTAAAWYSPRENYIAGDGGSQYGMYPFQNEVSQTATVAHIYTHEMGHAIDSSLGGRHGWISDRKAWENVWNKEINRPSNPLSAYAKTNKQEGFAEFYRAVVHEPEQAKAQFPRAWAYFEKKGLTNPEGRNWGGRS